MKPAPFEYERPETVDGALAALGRHGEDCRILAGGQSLIAMMNMRLLRPRVLVDIGRIPSLDRITLENGMLVVGALARHDELARSKIVRAACPLMAEAYPHVSHRPVRNRGTLVGNLVHADPASEMPAVALVCEAEFTLMNASGERRVPAAEFFRGPFETAIRADELATEVRIPAAPAEQGWGFHEFSPRRGDFALAAVAALLTVADGRIAQVRLASAGVGPCTRRLAKAEAVLDGAEPGAAAFAEAAAAAARTAEPQEDYHADAAYRRDLLDSMMRRALADAHDRATGGR